MNLNSKYEFEFLSFDIVSNFDIRASNLIARLSKGAIIDADPTLRAGFKTEY